MRVTRILALSVGFFLCIVSEANLGPRPDFTRNRFTDLLREPSPPPNAAQQYFNAIRAFQAAQANNAPNTEQLRTRFGAQANALFQDVVRNDQALTNYFRRVHQIHASLSLGISGNASRVQFNILVPDPDTQSGSRSLGTVTIHLEVDANERARVDRVEARLEALPEE